MCKCAGCVCAGRVCVYCLQECVCKCVVCVCVCVGQQVLSPHSPDSHLVLSCPGPLSSHQMFLHLTFTSLPCGRPLEVLEKVLEHTEPTAVLNLERLEWKAPGARGLGRGGEKVWGEADWPPWSVPAPSAQLGCSLGSKLPSRQSKKGNTLCVSVATCPFLCTWETRMRAQHSRS